MRYSIAAAAVAATVIPLISAHGFVSSVTVNGVSTPGADPVWYYYTPGTSPLTAGWNCLNQDLGFVSPSSYGSSDIACHKSATAGKLYVNANAGSTLTLQWNTWPDSHKGPIINYLAQCSGECTSASADSLRWTKISQSSLISSGYWVTDQMIQNGNKVTVTIPRNLRPGNYVLRHEIIALHGAGSDNGAQNYPQCLNIKVGGSGSVSLPSGTSGTSLYTRNHPGILFNLYNNPTSYPYPGPSLWTGAN